MRRVRWADLLLILAIVPLGVWAWRTARERSRLEATHARLRDRLGHLDVPDRTRFAFRALPSGSPTEFAWRAYHPAGPWSDESRSAEGGGGGSSRPVPGTSGAWETPDGPIDGVLLWIESQPAGAMP